MESKLPREGQRQWFYICLTFLHGLVFILPITTKSMSFYGPQAYGKCSISSNTLAVRTPKLIMKLLFKTFSFSSNSELFYAFEFLILRTHAKLEYHTKKLHFIRCFVFPTQCVKRRNSISGSIGHPRRWLSKCWYIARPIPRIRIWPSGVPTGCTLYCWGWKRNV